VPPADARGHEREPAAGAYRLLTSEAKTEEKPGSIEPMDVLLVSPDPASRELTALAVRSVERALGGELRFRAAANG